MALLGAMLKKKRRRPKEGERCRSCAAVWCKNPHGELAILHLRTTCAPGQQYQTIPLQPQN